MQFYVAMVDESDNAFTTAMKREDLLVYDFNLSQSEGDFATLDLTIQNPRIGLLNSTRKQWLWFAAEHPTLGTIPLFFGRIVALPEDLDEDYIKIQYVAKPSDYEDRKNALALSMCVAPYWDPIWFDSSKPFDPDNVLEFRPALWHIDPVTHNVTFTNIIEGEDGNISLGEADVFYDSVKLRYGTRPLTSVTVSASVSWDQIASGSLDVTSRVLFNNSVIETYTGEGLSKGWPAAGKSFGGGWTVGAGSGAVAVSYSIPFTEFEPGYSLPSQARQNWTPFEYFTFDAATFSPHGGLVFVKTNLLCTLNLAYNTTRRYSENLSLTLYADVQPIISDILSNTTDHDDITMSSSELNQPIDAGGLMPIRDARSSTFFATDRGDLAIQSLLALARARLLSRARCVDIDIEVPPLDALAWYSSLLRKNITFTDHRMPGAVVTGKVSDFSFKLSGDDGDPIFAVTIKSTVGQGSTVSAVDGVPEYIEEDYIEHDYQVFDGAWLLPALGDVVYQPQKGKLANDDGMNFFRLSADRIVTSCTIHNPASVQEPQFPLHGGDTDSANPGTNFPAGTWSQYYLTQGAIQSLSGYNSASYRPDYSPSDALKALNDIKTTVEVHLKDLTGGPFETAYTVPTSDLVIPRLIDLESSSTP